MPPKSSPVMSALPTARRWTMCLPISTASDAGNSPSGYGPLRRRAFPLSFGSLGMEYSFYHSPDHRYRNRIASLLPNLAVIAHNLKAVREALKPQHLAWRQAALAVHQQIVVGRARSQRARIRVAGYVPGLVLMPDGRRHLG